jgi:hypothetical protein
VADTIRVKRGTASTWTGTNPRLALGERGVETDTGQFKTGDGVGRWNDLPYDNVAPDVVSLARYTKGDGIADDSAGFLAALTAAAGRPIYGRPGSIYRFASGVTYAGSVCLRLRGTTIRCETNAQALTLQSGPEPTGYALTANYTVGSTSIDVALPEALRQPGRKIKIVAPLAVDPGNRDKGSNDDQFIVGEHAEIGIGSTSSAIVLRAPLRFTTGISRTSTAGDEARIAAYTTATGALIYVLPEGKADIELGAVEYPTGQAWAASAVLLQGFDNPRVTADRIGPCYSVGVTFSGCYGGTAENLRGRDLSSNPGSGQFGYLATAKGGTGLRIIGGGAASVRHGVTTGAGQIPATGWNVWEALSCGRSPDMQVTGMYVSGGNTAGLDTHHSADDTVFLNCVSEGATNAAFQARGRNIAFINPTVINCGGTAFRFNTEADSGDPDDDDGTAGKTVDDFTSGTLALTSGVEAARIVECIAASVRWSGSSRISATGGTAIRVFGGDMEIDGDHHITVTGAGASTDGLILIEDPPAYAAGVYDNSVLTIVGKLTIDGRACTTSGLRGVKLESDANCRLVVSGHLHLILPAGATVLSSIGTFECVGNGRITFENAGGTDSDLTTNTGTRSVRLSSDDGTVQFDGVAGPARALYTLNNVLTHTGTGALVGNVWIPPGQAFAAAAATAGAGTYRLQLTGRKTGIVGVAQIGLFGPGTGTGSDSEVAVMALPNTANAVAFTLDFSVTFHSGAQTYYARLVTNEAGVGMTTNEVISPEAFTITAHALRIGMRCAETNASITIDTATLTAERG